MDGRWVFPDRERADGMSKEEQKILRLVLSNLRQAYALLNAGVVSKQQEFARGLIAPQIKKLEKLADIEIEVVR